MREPRRLLACTREVVRLGVLLPSLLSLSGFFVVRYSSSFHAPRRSRLGRLPFRFVFLVAKFMWVNSTSTMREFFELRNFLASCILSTLSPVVFL